MNLFLCHRHSLTSCFVALVLPTQKKIIFFFFFFAQSLFLFEMPGVSVNDVDSQQFVVAVAKYLKRSGKIQLPKYHDYAKTASYKELSPMDPDWFYVRAGELSDFFRHIFALAGICSCTRK
jgi:hypothetical protein